MRARHLSTLVLAWLLTAPSSWAQEGMEQVRPWLGIGIGTGPVGVLVEDVFPGTPAEQYGLQAGDQITAIASTPVRVPSDLVSAVRAQGVGATPAVTFVRDGRSATLTVKLVAMPDEQQMLSDRLVGKPAPAFDLQVMHGTEPGSLADLKGRVVLVEFWATWCPACRTTHPRLSELATSDKRIAVLAISGEDEAVIQAYVARNKPAFTVLRDAKHETPGKWPISAIPVLVVIDKAGQVAFATLGAGSNLEDAITVARRLAGP